MFAPGAGRPLLVTAGLLLLGAAAIALHGPPFSDGLLLLIALGAGFWGFFAGFFRDPDRRVGRGIVSAADGKVRAVTVEGDRTRISVFMNVTDVHVNRMPLDGTFARIDSGGAGYRPAYRTDADRNVARAYQLTTSIGPVEIVQITGIVARRLVTIFATQWGGLFHDEEIPETPFEAAQRMAVRWLRGTRYKIQSMFKKKGTP